MNMKLSIGDAKPVRLDDGSSFLVTPVRAHGYAFTASALVVNDAIQEKAAALLPAAQAMAEAKSTRCNFLRRSASALLIGGEISDPAYQLAEQEVEEARRRVGVLFALAKGENVIGKEIIGVEDWRSILFFFHQDTTVGAVPSVEG